MNAAPEPDGGESPRTMALWRCIACGAMGRLADCTGQCAFREVRVVEGQAYADLFEAGERASAFLAAARPVLTELAASGDDVAGFEAAYEETQRRARAALKEGGTAPPPDLAEDRPPVWLCDTCGMVEAPQECLGVCVRPVRDFVAAQDYDALAAATRRAHERAERARALLSALARTRPRAGQWRRAARHFSQAATLLG